jgi:hypothetical protein
MILADRSAAGSGVSIIDVRLEAVSGYEAAEERIIADLEGRSSRDGRTWLSELWKRSGCRVPKHKT